MWSSSLFGSPSQGDRALLPGGLVKVVKVCTELVHFERLDEDLVRVDPTPGHQSGSMTLDQWMRLIDPRSDLLIDSLQG
jgi:hypothetical protein